MFKIHGSNFMGIYLPNELNNQIISFFYLKDQDYDAPNSVLLDKGKQLVKLCLVFREFHHLLKSNLDKLKKIFFENISAAESYNAGLLQRKLPTGLKAAIFRKDEKEVWMLIKAGWDTNERIMARGGKLEPLLHLSVRTGSINVVLTLLKDSNLKVNAQCENQLSAIDLAKKLNRQEILVILDSPLHH